MQPLNHFQTSLRSVICGCGAQSSALTLQNVPFYAALHLFYQCGKDQAKKYIQLVMMAVCVKLLFGFLITSLEPHWKGF